MNDNTTGYVARYSTSGPVAETNWSLATTFVQSWTLVKNGSTETREITNLNANTRSWFAIKAYHGINYGLISNSPSGKTNPQAPPITETLVIIAACAVVVVVVGVAAYLVKKPR